MTDFGSPAEGIVVRLKLPHEGVSVSVAVRPLGGGQYQLLEHPFLTAQPQYGDVISAFETGVRELLFQAVIEKSSLEMADYGLSSLSFESELLQKILRRIMESGGFWQLDLGVLFVFFDPQIYDPRDEIKALVGK